MDAAQEAQWNDFVNAWNRAFANVALAIVSNWPREKLQTLGREFRFKALPPAVGNKLRATVAQGDVTCIVPQPEPFTWIIIKCGNEYFRTVYGIWVGRPASWRGQINPNSIPLLGVLTLDEAMQKGIPIPEFKD
jgi:hypothetical protein